MTAALFPPPRRTLTYGTMNFPLSLRLAHLFRGYRLAAAILLLPAVFLLTGCADDASTETTADEAAEAEVRALPVDVIVVEPGTFEDRVVMTGAVEAPDDAVLSAESAGTLTAIAPLGTTVRRGGTVAQVNATLAQASVAQAEASLEAARAQAELAEDQFRRQEPLYQDSILSALEFQSVRTQQASARAQVAQAEAVLAQARQQLANTRVTAPFTGIVEERLVERGEQVAPGTPVARLVSTDQVKVKAGVPERYAGDIQVGTPVRVIPQSSNVAPLSGTVTFVGRAINAQNRTFPIEVALDDPQGLRPEMIVRLEVRRNEIEDAIALPLSAIVRDERGASVLVVREGDGGLVAEYRPTELGPQSGGYVVVESGLSAGDRVIATGQTTVAEGDRVRINDERPSSFAPVRLAD